ncbi:hypothetical protein ACH9L7_15730 [Haloferax sp. S1W]|uniref:hypothetical protein n=1 Tax=Haloferax sp. S1W TaxID=3377110 RepID=UPI0037C7822F
MKVPSRVRWTAAACVSGGVILYSVIGLGEPTLGLPGIAGLVTTYTSWRRDEASQAAVLVAFWVVLGALLWSSNQMHIISSVVAVSVAYFGWYGLND